MRSEGISAEPGYAFVKRKFVANWKGRDNDFESESNRGSGNLFTNLWRAKHTGQVLPAMVEGGTVASLSLLGFRFQDSHRGKTSFLLFWGKHMKQYVVCCVLVSEHLKLGAAHVQETYNHFSSVVGNSRCPLRTPLCFPTCERPCRAFGCRPASLEPAQFRLSVGSLRKAQGKTGCLGGRSGGNAAGSGRGALGPGGSGVEEAESPSRCHPRCLCSFIPHLLQW